MIPIVPHGTSFSSRIDVPVEELGIDPVIISADASKAGLYCQFYIKDGKVCVAIIGPFDELDNFRATL